MTRFRSARIALSSGLQGSTRQSIRPGVGPGLNRASTTSVASAQSVIQTEFVNGLRSPGLPPSRSASKITRVEPGTASGRKPSWIVPTMAFGARRATDDVRREPDGPRLTPHDVGRERRRADMARDRALRRSVGRERDGGPGAVRRGSGHRDDGELGRRIARHRGRGEDREAGGNAEQTEEPRVNHASEHIASQLAGSRTGAGGGTMVASPKGAPCLTRPRRSFRTSPVTRRVRPSPSTRRRSAPRRSARATRRTARSATSSCRSAARVSSSATSTPNSASVVRTPFPRVRPRSCCSPTQVDALFARAVELGATVDRPLSDESHGRVGIVIDPFGHRWMIHGSGPAA